MALHHLKSQAESSPVSIRVEAGKPLSASAAARFVEPAGVGMAGASPASKSSARGGLSGPPRLSKKPLGEIGAQEKSTFDSHIPNWARAGQIASHPANARTAETTSEGVIGSGRAAGRGKVPFTLTQLLTIQQTAALLNVSSKTIHRLIGRGELAAVRVGRSIRLRSADLERLTRGAEGD
jgi:excisionase family DNA binding protein